MLSNHFHTAKVAPYLGTNSSIAEQVTFDFRYPVAGVQGHGINTLTYCNICNNMIQQRFDSIKIILVLLWILLHGTP